MHSLPHCRRGLSLAAARHATHWLVETPAAAARRGEVIHGCAICGAALRLSGATGWLYSRGEPGSRHRLLRCLHVLRGEAPCGCCPRCLQTATTAPVTPAMETREANAAWRLGGACPAVSPEPAGVSCAAGHWETPQFPPTGAWRLLTSPLAPLTLSFCQCPLWSTLAGTCCAGAGACPAPWQPASHFVAMGLGSRARVRQAWTESTAWLSSRLAHRGGTVMLGWASRDLE